VLPHPLVQGRKKEIKGGRKKSREGERNQGREKEIKTLRSLFSG